ncbi:V-SNARE [Arthroderma uncinatum]|uniref:V-SNARE n=1 Tax=Arthroderma uncinatum TaxID=74035 RepID=UPI00144ABD3E|nr:V-SNARE [Arthroderma uncinatum]KAF3482229.1 V-SNARE [Arthroderma uncinatum]
MSNPSQLFLLADHIKLSLLERQRAISLELEPNSQDGEISRSLESLREGLESVEKEAMRLISIGDSSSADFKEQTNALRAQYEDLSAQFHENDENNPSALPSSSVQPNNAELAEDFIRASSTPSILKHPTPQHPVSKSVRFTDSLTASAEENDPNRDALLRPYSDSPQPGFNHSDASNQEIHDYHSQVMQEQDDHLDRLGPIGWGTEKPRTI